MGAFITRYILILFAIIVIIVLIWENTFKVFQLYVTNLVTECNNSDYC